MKNRTGSALVMHGAIVIGIGLLVGFPYASAITGGWGAEAERAWRTAHLEGLLNGMLVVLLGVAAPQLALRPREEHWLRWSGLATGYGNVVAASLGAAAGVRGLAPGGPAANLVVFALFTVAIVGVVAAVALLGVGARRALAERA